MSFMYEYNYLLIMLNFLSEVIIIILYRVSAILENITDYCYYLYSEQDFFRNNISSVMLDRMS